MQQISQQTTQRAKLLLDGETPNQVTLRYFEKAPAADKLLRLVDQLNLQTPVRIVPVATSVNIGQIERVAVELMEEDGKVARSLGVPDSTGAAFDMRSGEIILTTSNEDSVQRLSQATGVAVVHFGGLNIRVQYDPADHVAGFQVMR